jgi:CBS domain-containing protein
MLLTQPALKPYVRHEVGVFSPQDTVQAVSAHMRNSRFRAILLADNGEALGLITESQLVDQVLAQGLAPSMPIGQLNISSVVYVSEYDTPEHALFLMEHHQTHYLIVVTEQGEFSGLISYANLLRYISRKMPPVGEEAPQADEKLIEALEQNLVSFSWGSDDSHLR